jgi:hypothetical protein
MMTASTVDEYIDSLPEDRRIAIRAVRELVNSRIPPGYEEGIVYGMISWFVPFTRLAETYNNQPLTYCSLASQKSHMALYMVGLYSDAKARSWFDGAYKKSGKKLDMGKSCLRFKNVDALALDVIGEAIAKIGVDEYVKIYEKSREGTAEGKKKAKAAKVAKRKPAKKAKPVKKAPKKKPATKRR